MVSFNKCFPVLDEITVVATIYCCPRKIMHAYDTSFSGFFTIVMANCLGPLSLLALDSCNVHDT